MNYRRRTWRAGLKTRRVGGSAGSMRRAVVLLEIILALTLFVAAAGVILGALHASIESVNRIRTEARAADLAVTLMSEMRMGLVEPKDDGPNEYEDPLEHWTWQIVTCEVEDQGGSPPMKRVEIVIRQVQEGYVYRMAELFACPDAGGQAVAGAFGPGGTP